MIRSIDPLSLVGSNVNYILLRFETVSQAPLPALANSVAQTQRYIARIHVSEWVLDGVGFALVIRNCRPR